MSMKVRGVVLSDMTVSYLETILWAEGCSLPVPEDELVNGCKDVDVDHPWYGINESDYLDEHFGIDDFSDESLDRAESDCVEFFNRIEDLIGRARRFANSSHIAYDFWLTRQGHGAGFWDGDYADETDDVGDELSKVAAEFGECYIVIGEDGQLHIEG
jgi:hypothetical protein